MKETDMQSEGTSADDPSVEEPEVSARKEEPKVYAFAKQDPDGSRDYPRAVVMEDHDSEIVRGITRHAEKEDGETKVRKKGKSSGLYEISTDGEIFEVTLPNAFSDDWEAIVGFVIEEYDSREDAERAVVEAKQWVAEEAEKASLKKSFTLSYRVDELRDGRFRLVTPGLVDLENGNLVGTTHKDFDSWQEARDHYLKAREGREVVTHKPLLEIETGRNEKIAFSELDAFNPQVAPSDKAHEIPEAVKKYIIDREADVETNPNDGTYQETIKEKGWEGKLYTFVSSYVQENEEMIVKELGIEHLDNLTPKQAIELATRVVVDLTKYKYSDARGADGRVLTEKTKADQSGVLEILQEGRAKRRDPDWEGNGVCRNYACAVKAVFEALKTKQTKFNFLRDTYCLVEGGTEGYRFKREKKNDIKTKDRGHAWNTFVTTSRQNEANTVIMDATWAGRNLDTGKMEGLDRTLTRMEPIVNVISDELESVSADPKSQLDRIVSYYALKMARLEGSKTVAGQGEREFCTMKFLELMHKYGIPENVPTELTKAIVREYSKNDTDVDRIEIEIIYQMTRNDQASDFAGVLKNYLKDKKLSDYHAHEIMFKEEDLQVMVFEILRERKDFYDFLKESPVFRGRMRGALPQLFIGFSPEEKPEDAAELRYLLNKNQGLMNACGNPNFYNMTEENVKKIFERARKTLRDMNPQRYDEIVAEMSDYKIISKFSEIAKDLKG